MFETVTLALKSVFSHKIRSFLTMLGIIIGIASIITIVSTIKGTNEQIKENLIGSGVNAVVVRLYQNDNVWSPEWGGDAAGVRLPSPADLQELNKLDHVRGASAYYIRDWADGVYYGDAEFSGAVLGVDENYFSLYGYAVSAGRGFTAEEYASPRKKAIVEESLRASLFGGKDPVGRTLEIRGETFTVVGVVSRRADFTPTVNTLDDYYTYMDDTGGKLFLPAAAWPIVYRFDEPAVFAVGADETDNMTKVGQKSAAMLSERLVHSQTFSYRSEDLLEQARKLQELSASSNRLLIWIAGISLIVGGIGVMNIMLVTVTERTREIGLKKAIGAKKKRILRQFLTEAAVMTSMGGILGVLAGVALAKLLSFLTQTPAAVSVPAILVSVVFSTVIGVIFGLIPAIKAASLDPIVTSRE